MGMYLFRLHSDRDKQIIIEAEDAFAAEHDLKQFAHDPRDLHYVGPKEDEALARVRRAIDAYAPAFPVRY